MPRSPQIARLRLWWTGLAIAFLLVFVPAPAAANTYLFSFTTSQLMTALQASQGPAIYAESAYYAIFVQPDPVQITTYSYSSVNSPNPADSYAWVTSTITDPSNPDLGYSKTCTSNCTWAYFEKNSSASEVAVVSGANGGSGGANIFMNGPFYSDVPAPYGWGNFSIVKEIMPGSSVFSFLISTPLTLSGTYTIKGRAFGIKSGDPTVMTIDTKEADGIPFSLTQTFGVPEPGGWVLMLTGAALLVFGHQTRKQSRQSANSQQ